MFYSNETPAGTINGINTTFTTAHTLYQAIIVAIDGALYTGSITYTGGNSTFTVGDAPTVSISISYYDVIIPVVVPGAITVRDCRTEYLQRKKDISDIDAIAGTFLKWCNYVNRYAYREFTNILPESYIKLQTYTTVNGTSAYALPSDFQDILPQGTGMYAVNENGDNTDTRLPITGFASTNNGFYLTASQIIFTPTPLETKSWNFRYIPMMAELTTEESTLIIPQRFSNHVMNALDTCYVIWDEGGLEEIFSDQRFIRSMNEIVSLINPMGQTVGLPDFQNTYYY